MSEHSSDTSADGPLSVPDEQLPDDVRPSEDNPLAQPAGDDVPDDILMETSERRPLEDDADEADETDDSADAEAGQV